MAKDSTAADPAPTADAADPKAGDATAPAPSQWGSVVLLFVLYLMQGVPMGFAFGSLPFLLQESGASYAEIALFSAASYPFSLKLIWAPIIDALYWRAFGRRKSWIVPMQFAIGVSLVVMSARVDAWMAPATRDVPALTGWFLAAMLFASAQDIAVDGWSVTLLHAGNQSLGSMCQTFGQAVGYALSYSAFFTVNTPAVANRLRAVPSDQPLITLSAFLGFWGVAFLVVTTGLALLKREQPSISAEEEAEEAEARAAVDAAPRVRRSACGRIVATYRKVYDLVRGLPHMHVLLVVLLTQKLPAMVAENMILLKLTEAGLSKDNLALAVAVTFPFDLLYPLLAAPIVRATPDRPLARFTHVFVARLAIAALGHALVAWYPGGAASPAVMGVVVAWQIAHDFLYMVHFVQCSSFFTRIADESFGGTYYTLLATTLNLGFLWPRFVALSGTEWYGFEAMSALALAIGVLWIALFHTRIRRLGELDPAQWLAPKRAASGAAKPHAA